MLNANPIYTETPFYHRRPAKPEGTAPAATWSGSVYHHCDRFYKTALAFDLHASEDESGHLITTLENIHRTVAECRFPVHVDEFRRRLLDTMSGVVRGLQTALKHRSDTTALHFTEALRHLHRLGDLLNTLATA